MVKLLVIDILIILGTVMIRWEDYSRKGCDNHDDGKIILGNVWYSSWWWENYFRKGHGNHDDGKIILGNVLIIMMRGNIF